MPTTAPVLLKTPLGDDALLIQSFESHERLSALGETSLQLRSEQGGITADQLLGKCCTITIDWREGPSRAISGYATRFVRGGFDGRHYAYQMTLRPWPWLLTRTRDCRIFQEMTVPDIVKQVFADHPVANVEFKLYRSYRSWIYCVQYRETDFDFIARLFEHEGIYWYLEHADGSHKLVVTDSASAHDPAPDCASLPFYARGGQVPPVVEYVGHWACANAIVPGKVVMTDYDFEQPGKRLQQQQVRSRSYDLSDGEVFDYPGGYIQAGDGVQYVEDRLDEQQSGYETYEGWSNAQGLRTGCLLTLQRHPLDDLNADYLVTATRLGLTQPVHEASDVEFAFSCEFEAMPRAQQFRPPRRTHKPSIPGPQTALVCGPPGEEIFTDKYGRVKVQFQWDRRGRSDERSSCWVSVSSPWAGSRFGGVHVPRIGQEVVVGFLEGDPDRPLVIGRTYNGDNMPPWDLPANATQSGILSRSSKGGSYGNANAIRFEDKKGAEQLWLHAEKNQDIEVENDETHWVGRDRSKTVDHDETTQVKHDRTETVGNDETIAIGVDRKETVGRNETIAVGADRSEQVGANETIAIGLNRSETVGADETIAIASNRSISVGASETATVALQRTHTVGVNETIAIGGAQEIGIGAAQMVVIGAIQSVTVGLSQSTEVGVNQSNTVGEKQTNEIGADRSLSVGGAQATLIGKKRVASVGQDDELKVGGNLVVDAGDSITFKTGSASLTMKKDGTIEIRGSNITLDGSGKIHVKASGTVAVKGSKILQN